MSEIGNLLREAREQQGLTLEDIKESTHIRRVFIEALEEERFDALPDPVYGRGFLKNYAGFLGLEAEPLLEEYARRVGGADLVVPTILDEPLSDHSLRTIAGKAFRWLLLALLLAAAAWVFYSYQVLGQAPWPLSLLPTRVAPVATTATPVPPTAPVILPTPPAPTPTIAPTREPEPSVTPVPPTPTVTPVPPTPTSAPTLGPTAAAELPDLPPTPTPELAPLVEGQVRVELVASAETYLEIFNETGERIFQGYLEAGETMTQQSSRIDLLIGNAGGVTLLVNGQDQGTLGVTGEVVNLTFDGATLP